MRKKWNVKIAIIAIALAAFILTIAVATSSKNKTVPEETPRELANLNETLTNAMSDSLELEGLDKVVKEYMTFWALRGVSISVMRNDSLLFSKGYGKADEGVQMEPGNILRLASVSKLITATGIMVLEEQGKLSLQDTVFGPSGILNDSIYTAAIKDRNYYKITIEHLLRHQGGFSRRGGDPMFSTRWLMMQNGWTAVPSPEQLVTIQLKRNLAFVPGTSQYYSNFGYFLLSLAIERISGMAYEDFIQEYVLHPADCIDFKIAGNYYEDKYPNEVRYYVQDDDEPVEEFNNSGRLVPRCYGGNNVAGLSGAGAWVASTPELARFVASIDGKPEIPDIISGASVARMTEYFDTDTYSLGWNDTKPDGTWTRTGTFAGTSALIKYFPDGECWIFVSNTSTYKGPGLANYTSKLFEKLREKYSSKLPKRNLFYVADPDTRQDEN